MRFRHLCGTAPDSHATRQLDRQRRPWRMTGSTAGESILQAPSKWRREQGQRPSCGGQTASALIEVVFPEFPRASAVDLWRGARRRLGFDLDDLDRGTKWSAILAELDLRGFDDWNPGEDEDPREGGRGAPPAGDNLRDEMRASDRRGLVDYQRLFTLDEIDDALAAGAGVGASFGTRDAFDDLGFGEIADTHHLGGSSGGHAMRLLARIMVGGRRIYVTANWWGDRWGGCAVEGLMLPGHCLIDESAVDRAWDVLALTRR